MALESSSKPDLNLYLVFCLLKSPSSEEWESLVAGEEGGRMSAFAWQKGQSREWAAPQMLMGWLLVSDMEKGVSVLGREVERVDVRPHPGSREEMDSVLCLLSRLCKRGCPWRGK